jgi:hypothetical protein
MTFSKSLIVLVVVICFWSGGNLFAESTTQPSQNDATVLPDLFTRPMLLDDDDDKSAKTTSIAPAVGGSRYFFDLLDGSSKYGKDFFPDVFLGPDFDADSQLELDYAHAEKRAVRSDEIDGEIQWNIIGQLTIAAEFGWESTSNGNDSDDAGSGFENVDLSIQHPIFQYVSRDGIFDYSAVARLDASIPTRTPVSSTDVALTPYLGQLLRIGDHVSVQAWAGCQVAIGPDQFDQMIYGAQVGYQFLQSQLPVEMVDKITPILELDGTAPLSIRAPDALFGVAGVEISLESVGDVQPQFALGVELPIDEGARDQLRYGLLAQFFLQF